MTYTFKSPERDTEKLFLHASKVKKGMIPELTPTKRCKCGSPVRPGVRRQYQFNHKTGEKKLYVYAHHECKACRKTNKRKFSNAINNDFGGAY